MLLKRYNISHTVLFGILKIFLDIGHKNGRNNANTYLFLGVTAEML